MRTQEILFKRCAEESVKEERKEAIVEKADEMKKFREINTTGAKEMIQQGRVLAVKA